MVKILNFGSLNIDYTYDVDRFVQAGETLSSTQMQVSVGGKGLNQSIAASLSGADTYHAGAVGQSEDSHLLLEALENAGVDTRWISSAPCPTGHAIMQRDPGGQNCILLYGGANQRVTSAHWIILQNEISAVGTLMELAHQKGLRIAFNPSPMDEKILTYPLHLVDLLILNEIEAATLCKVSSTDGQHLLRLLADRFPTSQVVLTLGSQGAWYRSSREAIFQPAFSVPVKDTTAAGDTFTGYLLGGLIQQLSPAEAMRQAAAAAALAVTKKGAAPSIPDRTQVLEFLSQQPQP